MNQATSFNTLHGQRGDAILEALFGMALMAIIGLGLGYASARATMSQRYLNTQNVVITSMREQLMNSGSLSAFCSGQGQSAVQVGASSLNLNCQSSSNTASSVSVSVDLAASGGHDDHHGGSLTAVLPASSVVTTLTVSTSANGTSSALVGGDGKIEMRL